jgi:arylsulfatase A-like enzyme
VVGVAVALGAALRFVPLVERASWPERPNVILISVDTQRADHLSCYGYERPTSPEIDRFAERAVRFTRAFTPYPWTLLAHMSLFTSLDPSAHGVRSDRALAPGIPTLAEHLRDAGYRTAAVLDDVVWLEAKYEFDRGFDVYLPIGGTAKEKQARISPLLDDLGDEPFFLFLHFFDVHSDSTALPYDSLDEFQRLFAGEYDGDFSGCSPEGVCASKYLKELEARGVVLEGADLEYLVALYDAGVRTFDRQAGVLFDELEERGLFETSITVVTADHGEAFFEHGVPLHSGVHDEVVRVPLLVRTPDRRQGAVVDDLVSLIDVAPTLLELCDIEPRGMQGQSFRDLLDGERSAPRRDWVLLDDGEDRIQGVRTASWKLMRANGRNWRLYDLERDPGEAQNVLARPGDPPPVFEELKRILEAEMEKLAAFRRTFAEQASVSRGDDRARLEALGYVDEASR